MKRLIAGFILILSGNCQAQFKISDASLKMGTNSLITSCNCNNALMSELAEKEKLDKKLNQLR
jgi:hypothetical protein